MSTASERQTVQAADEISSKQAGTPAPNEPIRHRITGVAVPCYSYPSVKNTVVRTLYRAATVDRIEEKRGWIRIKPRDGTDCWVESKYCISERQLKPEGIAALEKQAGLDQMRWIVVSDSIIIDPGSRPGEHVVLYSGEEVTRINQEGSSVQVASVSGHTAWIPASKIRWYYSLDKHTVQTLIDSGVRLRIKARQARELASVENHERMAEIIAAGRNQREIERVLARSGGVFQRKYEERLKQRPSIRGSVKVGFSIRPDGSTDSVRVLQSSIRDSILEKQVANVISAVQFKQLPEKAGKTRHEYVIPFIPVAQ